MHKMHPVTLIFEIEIAFEIENLWQRIQYR